MRLVVITPIVQILHNSKPDPTNYGVAYSLIAVSDHTTASTDKTNSNP